MRDKIVADTVEYVDEKIRNATARGLRRAVATPVLDVRGAVHLDMEFLIELYENRGFKAQKHDGALAYSYVISW